MKKKGISVPVPTSLVVLLVATFSLGKADAKQDSGPSKLQVIASGEYFITQTWSQEKDFRRSYLVKVPEHGEGVSLPVVVFLHGNGGNAKAAMRGFSRRNRKICEQFVTVFPNGYRESWNIVSERSKADDKAFIEAIIGELANRKNIDANRFSIMGVSNGAALVNQLAIESKLPNIRNYISSVSPLNSFQHDGKNFKARGAENTYLKVANPTKGKRLMNISGAQDRLIPYHGGPSPVIPAKGGKLGFVDAEDSIFLWAKQMGYEGERLKTPSSKEGKLEFFRYLSGDVVHIKVNGEGHGATGAIGEDVILKFFKK